MLDAAAESVPEAAKSTLLKAMSGILYTEEGVIENGTIRFRSEDVHRLAGIGEARSLARQCQQGHGPFLPPMSPGL